jgi:amino acid adenylation domain-containing protein
LLHGSRSVLLRERVASANALRAVIEREGVTTMWLTAALFNAVMEEDAHALRGVKQLLVGGEALSVEHIRRGKESLPETRLINGYGPTETTTFACCHEIGELGERELSIPIGKAIGNTQVYILDQRLAPVPLGVSGELYIGGAGLARGYLLQAELTAERFIPHPYSATGGERLYRTGDMVRYREDGTIDFIGRLDEQVKVRGYRIELGEIENALTTHPAVAESAVLARTDEEGTEKWLVGYLVLDHEAEPPGVGALRHHLQQQLPEYMIPAQFVLLEELPLTPNGKVDRRALLAADQVRPEHANEYTAPRTPEEEVLASIFQRVLRVERLGIHDNFFALGGHSLLAMQIVTLVRERFQLELPLPIVFECPTVAEVVARLNILRQQQSDLVVPPISKVDRDEPLPLSFAQQRLWFMDQLEPESALYNTSTAVRLRGELSVDALGRALDEITRRHESLRTSFRMSDGGPVQIIAPAEPLSLSLIELDHLPVEEREAEAQRIARQQSEEPFDLEVGPLLRATLVQLEQQHYVLVLVMHHIITDGWSVSILLRELRVLYKAFSEGKRSPLQEFAIQYADFAHWQRAWLSGETLDRQLSYWRKQLEAVPAVLELPTDYPRPPVQSFRGSRVSRVLSPSLAEALRQVSKQEDVTLFMTLLAALQTLLYRYSHQSQFCIGTPIANRNWAEVEPLIGFFVNTLVLRARLEDNPTFKQLLKRVRETCLDAYAHQDLPFEKLVEEMEPDRALSHTPLFQVMMTLQKVAAGELQLEGVTLGAMELENRSAKFDLTLTMIESEAGLAAVLEYNSELYKRETIERMLGHLEMVLEGIAGDVSTRVGDVALLTSSEREQLVAWNQTASEYPATQCIHELFVQQVKRNSNAIAVSCEGEELNYGELNERANQVAHYLRELGVTTETRVGICVERSIQMVVGLLGIMKAGGVYVPLDPEHPAQRLAFMMKDAAVSVLLTEEQMLAQLPTYDGPIVCLDRDWVMIAKQSVMEVSSEVSAANLTYIIYTSGSTGEPKGVAVSHQAINRLVFNAGYVNLNATDVVAQAANASFDAITFELWGGLLSGARVHIISQEQLLEPARLAKVLREEQVTAMFLTTALFNQMGRQQPAGFYGVKQLLFGGQQVAPQWVRAVKDSGYAGRLIHVYGPTETTTFATWHEVDEVEAGVVTIPIGKAIGNTEAHILDQRLAAVPVGVSGELYIGGVGLARGYWDRPGLTAERFVPHPFGEAGGERLYRTGDVARYREDGAIEFIGRLDEQVKVRGYRIELGEIENALTTHPAVAESAVLARTDEEGTEKWLVGYLVLDQSTEPPSVGELRQYLQQQLPEYMIPAQFVLLAELPLTPNGKVDRRALPAPDQARPESAAEYTAPRTSVEEILASIFQRVLRVERAGIHDNFFELGGHSLTVMQVISLIHKELDAVVTVRDMFTSPTVAEIAEIIGQAERSSHSSVEKLAEDVYYDLSYGQKQVWISCQIAGNATPYNVPVAYAIEGELNLDAFERALETIVARHESLRTSFVLVNDEPKQKIHDDIGFKVSFRDLTKDTRNEAIARRIANEEAALPFVLETGPLVRARMLKLAKTKHVFLLTMHHIVTDGWSINNLLKELVILYHAFNRNQESPLQPLRIQYKDYVSWQKQLAREKGMEDHEDYWLEKLAGKLPVLNLPIDKIRPAVKTFNGDLALFAIDKQTAAGLYQLSRDHNATLFMTLLASLYALFYRYTGQEDIIIGSPISGRNHSDLEDQIGLFFNMLALRATVNGEQSFKQLLESTRQNTLEAYEHQQYQLDFLLAKLNPERGAERHGLFDAVITLQNQTAKQAPVETQLNLARFQQTVKTSEYDICFLFTETGEKILVTINYNTDLFVAETIDSMWFRYAQLLEQVVADRAVLLLDLELSDEDDELPEGEEILIELGV